MSSARPSWEGGSCNRHLNQACIICPSKCSASMAVRASEEGKMWHKNRQQKLQKTKVQCTLMCDIRTVYVIFRTLRDKKVLLDVLLFF